MKLIDFDPDFISELQRIRRDIHAHPELGYEENRTSDLVAKKLTEWDIPVLRGIAETGVVGIIKSGNGKRAVGLRADLDALPMQELNKFAHSSRHPGRMHACGHDGHTAMLLGAARYLSQHRNFDGTVYAVFQPAEESVGGANRMIEDGLFQQCPMDAIFGMHNWPGRTAGKFGVRSGAMMASSNTFTLTIKGLGSHAGQPNRGVDPIMTAIQVAQSWQTIITRNKVPTESAILSITQIHAGSATNVVPDNAVITGTVRTFSAKTLDLIERRMRKIAEHTAIAFDALAEFEFERGYPPLINDVRETEFAIDVIQSITGASAADMHIEPTMGAEDFAFYLQQVPGCYVFISNGKGEHREPEHGNGPCNLHTPSYDFNDDLLPIGMTYWTRLAEGFLRRG